jgi:hypothetical protein
MPQRNTEIFGKITVPRAILEKIAAELRKKQREYFVTLKQKGKFDSAINQIDRILKTATANNNCIISKKQLEFFGRLSSISVIEFIDNVNLTVKPPSAEISEPDYSMYGKW